MTVHFRMYSRFILAIDQHASVARCAKCFTYISLTKIFFKVKKIAKLLHFEEIIYKLKIQ